MGRPLKTCSGEHHENDPCARCDEDDTLCDLCWQQEADPLNVRAIAAPQRQIELEDGKDYVVCLEHYREHKRRVELELI